MKEAGGEDGEWEPWHCGVIVVGRELGSVDGSVGEIHVPYIVFVFILAKS